MKLFYNSIQINGYNPLGIENLELIEEYLKVYPDDERRLLFLDKSYMYLGSKASILPRKKRYQKTENGIRQYRFLEEIEGDEYLCDTKGNIIYCNLMEKLLLLCIVKFAALDFYGMGVEMEGLCGSSMAETYELMRLMEFCIKSFEKYKEKSELLLETAELLELMLGLCEKHKKSLITMDSQVGYWNEVNDYKEEYWKATKYNVSGKKRIYDNETIVEYLYKIKKIVAIGIAKAVHFGDGFPPCYFYYEITDFKEKNHQIFIRNVKVKTVPYFLEGVVCYLKLPIVNSKKVELYKKVKESPLYDKKLKMYKANDSYKYLLELLKSGMYEEFRTDFVKGKDFVDGLSGSDVECLHIWQIMMFGKHPFVFSDNNLSFQVEPFILEELIGDDKKIEATLLGSIPVTYYLEDKKDYIPGNYKISKYVVCIGENSYVIKMDKIKSAMCKKIRNAEVDNIKIYLERC